MLTKDKIDKHALRAADCPPATWVVLHSAMHRLVDKESAATAPLLAEIERLTRELEEARTDAMHEAALICDRLDADVDKYPAACAKAIREAAGCDAASQSDRMVLVPIEIDDCDEIVEAACNAGNLYRVDFIRAWQAAIRAAIKEQT